jgi:hypothetical protein
MYTFRPKPRVNYVQYRTTFLNSKAHSSHAQPLKPRVTPNPRDRASSRVLRSARIIAPAHPIAAMSSSDTDAQTVALYNAFQMDLAKAVLGLDSVLAAASVGLAIGAVILRRRERYHEKFSFEQLPHRTILGFLGANFMLVTTLNVACRFIATRFCYGHRGFH